MLREAGRPDEALHVLDGARERFSKLAEAGDRNGIEAAALTWTGDALRDLGRLDEAAVAYENGIQRHKERGDLRGVAVGQGQLGTVRYFQGRLEEALAAQEAARATFESLREPRMVATAWHQIGMVHAEAGNFDAAERAYKMSLSLESAQGNRPGEADTLGQLASLYHGQGRLEDSVALYQQCVELMRLLGGRLAEATALSNLALVLRDLRRFDAAREAFAAARALGKDYGHAASPWLTWAALEELERDDAQPEAAAEARRNAVRTYRAYRTDGGEPMTGPNRLIVAFGQTLRTAGPDAARTLLPDPTRVPDNLVPAIRALQAIAAGSRDPALADEPTLFPMHAVELALLLESL
jgi:tetratricopeptide (TPR) repeat protein